MGTDYIAHLFIGRPCTPKEIKRLWTELRNRPTGPEGAGPSGENLLILEMADPHQSMLTVPSGPSGRRYPVVLHSWLHPEVTSVFEETTTSGEFDWVVVEHYLGYTRHSDSAGIFMQPKDIPKPVEPNHGLMVLHEVSI